MRLLFLTSAFPPEAEGAATHLPEMASALQSRGHGVQVIAVVNRHEVKDTYNFRVRRISRSQFKPIRDLRIIWNLVRKCRKADTLYTYGVWWQAALACFVTGTPMIIKFTGDKVWEDAVIAERTQLDLPDYQPSSSHLLDGLLWSLTKFWGRLARRWVVSSDILLKVLLSWGVPREHVELIPNAVPVNPKVHEEATYLAQWDGQEGLRIITAGHILKAKKIEGILEAIARFEDIRLVVAGDGPNLDHIKNETRRLALEERVLFTGKVSRQDLAGYVEECDLLVTNSILGRFNYVIPEALARGKPVIATRRGLHPDLIEHGINGWLYEGETEELVKLIGDFRVGRLSPSPAEGTELPTWERQVDLTHELMESLAS